MPLPEVTKIRPDPSDMIPPPLCQIPPFSSLTSASSVHKVVLAVLAVLPTLKPAT